MNDQNEYSLPKVAVEAAIAHSRQKYNLKEDLDPVRLIELFRQIGEYRKGQRALMRSDPTIRVALGFGVARAAVLDTHFPRRNPAEDLAYRAHSSALGKIMAELGGRRAKPVNRRKRSERERTQDHVQLDRDGRQYRYRFSK